MAPTAYGSAAILIDSTACRRTLVYSNIERRPFFPRRANPPWAVPHRRACCHTSRMPSVCSAAYRYAPVCFQQQAPSTPPLRGGEPARRRHPAARDPRRPCVARAFRPRDAWAHPARRRSQPARGRRPVRGAVRRRREKAARRRSVMAAQKSGVAPAQRPPRSDARIQSDKIEAF